jgi:hypothetical protein
MADPTMTDLIETFRAALLHRLGGAPDVIVPGHRHDYFRTRRGPTSGWCFLFPNLQVGLFGCTHRLRSDAWFAHQAPDATPSAADIAEAERLHAQQHRTVLYSLWSSSCPITRDDPAGRYLAERGLLGDLLPRLRHRHPPSARRSRSKGDADPRLWVPVVDPQGRLHGLNYVVLSRDDIRTPEPLNGLSFALFPPAAGRIGIAESFEAALVAQVETGIPTMAVTTLAQLAAWQWPRGVHHLVACTEDDDRGHQAAAMLQDRAQAAGLHCDVLALRRRPDRFEILAAQMRASRP